MINQSFEQQQKQNKLLASPALKDLFYSQPNTTEDRKGVKNFEKDKTSSATQSSRAASDVHKSDSIDGPLFANIVFPSLQDSPFVPRESLTVGSPWTVSQGLNYRIKQHLYLNLSSNMMDKKFARIYLLILSPD